MQSTRTVARAPSVNALKLVLRWARSVQRQAERSKLFPTHVVRNVDARLERLAKSGDYLDILNLIPRTFERVYGVTPDMDLAQRKQVFGLDFDPLTQSFLAQPRLVKWQKVLEQGSIEQRKQEVAWRVSCEAEFLASKRWYPFFVTVTLDQFRVIETAKAGGAAARTNADFDLILAEFWKDGGRFETVVGTLERMCVDAVRRDYKLRGLTLPATLRGKGYRRGDFMRHCAVLEHGKSRYHHHIHLLIWLRDVPAIVKRDPNAGLAAGSRINRECKWLAALVADAHEFGSVNATYVRHSGDVWSLSECRHVWPDGAKTGGGVAPFKVGPASAVGGYMAKYLEKDGKEWNHRLKCSKGFGLDLLRDWLQDVPQRTLEALTWRPRNYGTNVAAAALHAVPLGLLRKCADDEVFRRLVEGGCGLESYVRPVEMPFLDMCRAVHDGAFKFERATKREFFDFVSSFLPVPEGYDRRRLLRAHKRVAKDWPRSSPKVREVPSGFR